MNYLDKARWFLANSPPNAYAVNAVNAETVGSENSGDTLQRLQRNTHDSSSRGFKGALSVNSVYSVAPEPIANPYDLAEVRYYLEACTAVGIDLETTGLNPRRDRVRLLTISSNSQTFIIDCFQVDPTPLFDTLSDIELVGHNLAFDLQFLGRLGFTPGRVWDSMLASQLLEGGLHSKHSLQEVARRYLNIELDKADQTADWSGPLTEKMLRYAARDAEVPLRLREVLLPKIREARLEAVCDLEQRCLPALVSMSLHGVAVDAERWVQLAEEAEQRQKELEAQLNNLALTTDGLSKGSRNWNSPAQVKQAFDGLGITLEDTADDTLATLDHPLAALLREYRALAKRTSAYGRDWLKHIENGRVYPQWRQCPTATGRMSCSNPNMQQLPRDPRYRQCFVAAPGHVLIKADFSQIELRLAAKIAREQKMIDAYQRRQDLHVKTAQAILGKTEVSKADRQLAKAINFGLLYGMGAAAFQLYARVNYGVELTEEQAKKYRAKFFLTYPGLVTWHRRQAGFDSSPKTTRTILGRQRLEVATYTEKLNSPVQGSGADGLKSALALLWERRSQCPTARLILAVHDEIALEVPQADADHARNWLVRCMSDAMRPILEPVPVVVDVSIGPTWAGATRSPAGMAPTL